MKSKESTSKNDNAKKKSINAKTKVVLLVFAFLLIIAIIAIPITKALKKVITEEEHEGYTKLRTSRYFFQLFFPEEWNCEQDINGFLLDDEKGLVCEISPEDGVKISVYYRSGEDVKIEDALISFEEEFSNYEFGEIDKINVESEKCELLAKKWTADEENGIIYVAARKMCYYGIVVSYVDEAKYKTFKTQIDDVIRSFEKVVFED